MPVRPLPLAADAFMGAAIGYLAPGKTYDVHFHYALEQLTFVVKGVIELTTNGEHQQLRAGDAVTNPPGATLQFANPGPEPAEVLFVCAPPFPPDGADVAVMDRHRPLSETERARQTERLDWALDHFRRLVEARRPR
jgi:YD repeat-containing protein